MKEILVGILSIFLIILLFITSVIASPFQEIKQSNNRIDIEGSIEPYQDLLSGLISKSIFHTIRSNKVKSMVKYDLIEPKEEEIRILSNRNNSPPSKPEINGPSQGKTNTEYEFGFCSNDPDGDDVYYCIDWGDGSEEVNVRPFPSGACVVLQYSWSSEKTYIIKALARDTKGAESETAIHAITLPKNRGIHSFLYLYYGMMDRYGFQKIDGQIQL
jgi:hypothetical protein